MRQRCGCGWVRSRSLLSSFSFFSLLPSHNNKGDERTTDLQRLSAVSLMEDKAGQGRGKRYSPQPFLATDLLKFNN